MIYMGIDPGLNKTGVGIIYAEKNKVEYVAQKSCYRIWQGRKRAGEKTCGAAA